MSGTLRRERQGRVLTVTLDNPPHNFLTTQMVQDLEALVAEVETDPEIGVVLLTGRDPVFISHFDVGEIAEGGDDTGVQLSPRAASALLRVLGGLLRLPGLEGQLSKGPLGGLVNLIRMHRLFERMERSEVVFIAAINGRALGGGFELALACDVRLIAAEHGVLGFPELNQAIIPGAAGTQRLTRALGVSRAVTMILDSRLIDSQTALDWGLVAASVPAAELPGLAEAWAQRLARRHPVAVAAAKQAIHAAFGPRGGHAERAGFVAAASTPAANAALKHYHQRLQSLAPAPGELEAEVEQWRQGGGFDLHAAAPKEGA